MLRLLVRNDLPLPSMNVLIPVRCAFGTFGNSPTADPKSLKPLCLLLSNFRRKLSLKNLIERIGGGELALLLFLATKKDRNEMAAAMKTATSAEMTLQ